MLDFLELEETVGRAWHAMVGDTRTWPRHPDAAVTLEEIRPVLSVCFRGFGGESSVQLAPARGRTSAHRLRLRQQLGLGEEKLIQPARDHATVMLPAVIDLLPERALNRDLYLWLAAAMANLPVGPLTETDPLRRDIAALARAETLVTDITAMFPGLEAKYRSLAAAVLSARRRGRLPRVERLVEDRVENLLRRGAGLPTSSAIQQLPVAAPAGYLPMLPVPLWPDLLLREEGSRRGEEDQPAASDMRAQAAGPDRHVAVREKADPRQGERSPFILNRFEKILAMAEMVKVDRPGDDSDDHDATAAEELDDMTLGEREGRPAARFRFDLDLPPEAVDRTPLVAELTYPEWDYRKGGYLPNHCRVLVGQAPGLPVSSADSDPELKNLIRRVRRRFETLRPKHEALRAQIDGADLDLDAVVRSRCDMKAGGEGSDRIHMTNRPLAHDLAVTLLIDVSLSTDAWVDDRRVLDVEKEALLVLANGLAACGDHHAILTFTSRRRTWVRIETVKDFAEPMGPMIESRIAALKPGYYTRIGAALRHATAKLALQPHRHKLLLVLTDGKPNDVDHYEGRFALEDSRKAVREARSKGVRVFGVTVDRDAQSYIPVIFGQNGYAVVSRIERLPTALPAIYRSLAN